MTQEKTFSIEIDEDVYNLLEKMAEKEGLSVDECAKKTALWGMRTASIVLEILDEQEKS